MNTDIASRLVISLADRYEIQGEVGAGGMATVYRAVDRKHQRDVAIKVLHPDLGVALGGERFLTEIRTTARLQHPHILPLLDSGEADGLLYYVMPLVTGETLRTRLDREQQLPIDDSLIIAGEIADALGYAHGLGVIHRDIKPENILLRDGHAVVADFGIALAVQSAGGARMTQTGLSLGTPQYMSPEQAMGERTIDQRSDVYALAAVTYEMLVGEPPFMGPTVQAIVARILTEDPRSITAQRKAVPDSAENAIMRALEKLPADRFSSAGEFAAALRGDVTKGAHKSPQRRAKTSVPVWMLPAVGLATLTIGAASAQMMRNGDVVGAPARNLAIMLPDSMRVAFKGSADTPGGQGSVTISADGRRIAWVGMSGRDVGGVRLYVRDMDSYSISGVPESDGAFAPVLSHDGSRLAYFSGRELREVTLAKGETRVIARDLIDAAGATYLGNGSILMAGATGQLTLIAPGGASRRLAPSSVADETDIRSVSYPSAAPGDGYAVAVVRGGPLVVVSLADGSSRPLRSVAGDTAARIHGAAPKVAGGRLYWLQGDVILLATLDVEGARITSEPIAVATGVRGDVLGAGDFDVAEDGTIVFVPGADAAIGHLAWLDHRGTVDTLPIPTGNYVGFDVSPNGRSLLTKSVTSTGATEIRVFDIARRLGSLVQVGTGDISQPGWLADGQSILVSVAPDGLKSARLLRFEIDRRSPPDTIMVGGLDRYAVARDGQLVLMQVTTNRSPNRYLGGEERPQIFASVNGKIEELPSLRGMLSPSLSADGKWVTYESYGQGEAQIFLERFPLDGRPIRVPGAGYEAFLSAKGDKLFYRVGTGIMQVPFNVTGDSVTFGEPQMWVKFDFADFMGRSYKMGADERVLVKLLPSTMPQSEIRVVTAGRGA